MRRMAAAAGLSVLLFGGFQIVDADPGWAVSQGGAVAAQPRFFNAQVQSREAGANATRAIAGALAAQRSPGWVGYSVAAVPGGHRMCESDRYPARAYLEGHPAGWRDEQRARDANLLRDVVVLFRADAGKVQKVRVFGTDCELDAGGLSVTWLTGVAGADSVAVLRQFVGPGADAAPRPDRLQEAALTAIALHRDASALRALESFVAGNQPEGLRKRAAFWLGAARGDEGFEVLRRLAASEKDAAFRRELVFPISVSPRQESTDLLIRLARQDDSPEVRKQAMLWLGQSNDPRALDFLEEFLRN